MPTCRGQYTNRLMPPTSGCRSSTAAGFGSIRCKIKMHPVEKIYHLCARYNFGKIYLFSRHYTEYVQKRSKYSSNGSKFLLGLHAPVLEFPREDYPGVIPGLHIVSESPFDYKSEAPPWPTTDQQNPTPPCVLSVYPVSNLVFTIAKTHGRSDLPPFGWETNRLQLAPYCLSTYVVVPSHWRMTTTLARQLQYLDDGWNGVSTP